MGSSLGDRGSTSSSSVEHNALPIFATITIYYFSQCSSGAIYEVALENIFK